MFSIGEPYMGEVRLLGPFCGMLMYSVSSHEVCCLLFLYSDATR